MKKIIVKLYISILYQFLSLFYDKKYLRGRQFPRDQMSYGWRMGMYFFWCQHIKGVNRHIPWMCDPSTRVSNPENIIFDVDYIDNFFSTGCYYQSMGTIRIGKKTQIAPNVGIITSNHDVYNPDNHTEAKSVIIGDFCWIGMNSLILPGVVLGDHTIVGGGAVVTKSYEDGNCIIAGNPARVIRKL